MEIKQIDGHYQFPQPLKNQKLELPNNQIIVERRINQLERRFRGDDSYFQHDKTFMDDILAKGILRNQHHLLHWGRLAIYLSGAFSLSKPSKIRVYLTVQKKLVWNQ